MLRSFEQNPRGTLERRGSGQASGPPWNQMVLGREETWVVIWSKHPCYKEMGNDAQRGDVASSCTAATSERT